MSSSSVVNKAECDADSYKQSEATTTSTGRLAIAPSKDSPLWNQNIHMRSSKKSQMGPVVPAQRSDFKAVAGSQDDDRLVLLRSGLNIEPSQRHDTIQIRQQQRRYFARACESQPYCAWACTQLQYMALRCEVRLGLEERHHRSRLPREEESNNSVTIQSMETHTVPDDTSNAVLGQILADNQRCAIHLENCASSTRLDVVNAELRRGRSWSLEENLPVPTPPGHCSNEESLLADQGL